MRVRYSIASRSGSENGTERNRSALTTENIAVVAPIPNANVRTTKTNRAGRREKPRQACRRSEASVSTMMEEQTRAGGRALTGRASQPPVQGNPGRRPSSTRDGLRGLRRDLQLERHALALVHAEADGTRHLVRPRFQVDLECGGFPRLQVLRQLALDPLPLDLEAVAVLAGIRDRESGRASRQCRRHVDLPLLELHLDL